MVRLVIWDTIVPMWRHRNEISMNVDQNENTPTEENVSQMDMFVRRSDFKKSETV